MDQAYVAVACAGASWNVQTMDKVQENLNCILRELCVWRLFVIESQFALA